MALAMAADPSISGWRAPRRAARGRPRRSLRWALDTCAACWRRCRRQRRERRPYRRAAEICDEMSRSAGASASTARADPPLKPRGDRLNALTHCNAGCSPVDWGTALARSLAHDAA